MLQFFHNLQRERPPPRHFAQILRHLSQHIGCSMREQQHRALALLFDHCAPNSFTHSTTRITFSTGVAGTMPWPRLKMCPGRPAAAVSTSFTRAFKTSSGANSVMGSRLPCTAHPEPTALHPTPNEPRQSSTITSAPVALISGSREVVSTPK